MESWVYFLRPVGMPGPIKVGVSVDPEMRLRGYNAIAPWELEIAATIPGDRSVEDRFHTLFAAHHSHHEWFNSAPEITAVIEALAAGAFDLSSLPQTKGSPIRKKRVFSDLARKSASVQHRLRWHEQRTGKRAPDEVRHAFYGRGNCAEKTAWAIAVTEAYLDQSQAA